MIKIFRKFFGFLLNYKLFGLVVFAVIISIVLQIAGIKAGPRWVLSIVSLAITVPLLRDMWQDLRTGTYGVDILAATAIITSVVLGQYWAAIVIVAMLTGGEALEDYAEHRAKVELKDLLTRAPQKAHVIRGRKTLSLPVQEVKVGDKIIIKPGEVVPVDAVILEGTANFDESSLTGESLPRSASKNDTILSGSISIDGAITARATHSAANSQYEQIIKLVQAAASSQARFVRLADRYSIPFTATAYAIAIAVWITSGHAVRFLEVIIVATPCPLILAAPIAFISGMSRASKFGVIVKTGSALEKLAESQTIAFDKTGTLTLGQLKVDKITAFAPFKKDEVLGLAASLEKSSNHILAQAIVHAAATNKVKLTKVKNVSEVSGRGLKASLRGKEILVGRASFIEENGVKFPAKSKASLQKQTATFMSIDGSLAGIITFKDELRAESKETLRQLKLLGIKHTLMVTGDNQATAMAIAKKLGITDVKAEALPADKLHAIEKVADRPVAFVGDGVNDAPVLTAADVGIALGARGSTAASESADVVIMMDDLSRVAKAVAVSKRTFSVAKQSVLIGIFISVGLMLVFATGKFQPVIGAALQEVVDVVVIFNALRAHNAGKNELA